MSMIHLTVKHGKTLDEARRLLEQTVQEIQARFGGMVQRVEWSPDRNQVRLALTGAHADLRVDPVEVHVDADIPILGQLHGAPVVNGLKQIIQQTFRKRLT